MPSTVTFVFEVSDDSPVPSEGQARIVADDAARQLALNTPAHPIVVVTSVEVTPADGKEVPVATDSAALEELAQARANDPVAFGDAADEESSSPAPRKKAAKPKATARKKG